MLCILSRFQVFSRSTFHFRIALKSIALRLRAKERPNVNAWIWQEGRACGWHSLSSLVCSSSQLHCHLRDYDPRGKSADFSIRFSQKSLENKKLQLPISIVPQPTLIVFHLCVSRRKLSSNLRSVDKLTVLFCKVTASL